MKARIKGTDRIVDCEEIVVSPAGNIKGFKCRDINSKMEIEEVIPAGCLIEIQDFDWQSFRVEAAKDIMCSIIQSGYYGEDRIAHQSELAVKYTDELVKALKDD